MGNTEDLRIAVCQMKVVPGRPDLNTEYMIGEIISAGNRGMDIIVFPEMCVPGYLIADMWEDDCFIWDVQAFNEQIWQATKNGVIAIFGSVAIEEGAKGRDGRLRKFNAAFVAQNGKLVGVAIKSLLPNYRFFDDSRHFYSVPDIRDEDAEKFRLSGDYRHAEQFLGIDGYLMPFEVETRIGRIPIGVILCEDMWHEDYPYNPTESLVQNGAEIVFNLSASPWTWQKNRKRHQVVKDLISKCGVPFVYTNNTGPQNIGKNIVIFDGASTVYNKKGDRVLEIEPYADGAFDLILKDDMPVLPPRDQNDQKELFSALECAVREYFAVLPPAMRRVVIGLSGGIDSAVVAAFFAHILGPENVIGINMPSKFNSQATKDIAYEIAMNLGIHYEVIPIQGIVDKIAEATGTPEDSLAYENEQARARMEVLAARAQLLGCLFSCNGNKIELTFGYYTTDGDGAGFMTLLGDMVKREVYQLGDYLNRVVYGREVIPRSCFEIKPSAELKKNQTDPFFYGNLDHRGYHDEMVRAFIDFRKNPEWFLEKYKESSLETELKLEPGTLASHFPDPYDFVRDLEEKWKRFIGTYFKRVKASQIPALSKRALGSDFRESMLSAHFTQRYLKLKEEILGRSE
ncbi:MAG: NAD(+) synthase [Candidatus Paceibacterota bacterium]|jgi:NAD+ synthase (glutamine-hydrolysing)